MTHTSNVPALARAEQMFESAMLHAQQGQIPDAIVQMQKVLELNPNHLQAWNNRGLFLLQLGHPFDAIMNIDRAVAIGPGVAEYYNNRGAALMELSRYPEALADYDRALALKQFEHAHNNRGNVLAQLGRPKDAQDAYRAAIRCNPDYVDAHLNLSFQLLDEGNFEEGWKGYEWRWRSNQLVQRGLNLPPWQGERSASPEAGLLIYAEQGFGDALQFMRYAALAKQKFGGKVYVEVRASLARITASMKGIDGVVVFGEKIPENITHCVAMMSLPLIMGTTVETIPNETPYLFADEHRIATWREKLKALPPGFKVGVCWAGMNRTSQPAAASIDARRSTTLAAFAPLAVIPGVSWVSLQKGSPAEQVQKPPRGMVIMDRTEELDDFYDTAALMKCLDLVVCVDTAPVHLSAALGVRTWMLSRFDGCWRWMGPRRDSPWYPTLTQYRQPSPGDWGSVMQDAAKDLRKLVSG